MKKRTKTILYVLGGIFVAAQLYRPAKNNSNTNPGDILEKYPASASVQQTLKTACYDCHSNNTVYPWYAQIQPVASWLADHIEEGKRHFNFSEFTNMKIAVQNHKFEELVEMVDEGEMPLSSYTVIHRDAILSPEQKQELTGWAKAAMDTLKPTYPADSLILKRKKQD